MSTENESATFLEELRAESAGLGANSQNLNTDYDAEYVYPETPSITDDQAVINNGCSVVLVAGLGGDPVGTWRADDEQKTLWPTSLLPLCIGDIHVRIWTFRYSSTLRGSASAASIRDHANVLLGHLNNQREEDDEAKLRPIVFVGHSLGGILIKQVGDQLPTQPLFFNPC
jgi:hypothetical protein